MQRLAALAVTLAFSVHTASPLVRTAAAQSGATLSGIAQGSSGQPLVNYRTQLRNVLTGLLVAETTSSAAGSFTFTGLDAASYMVEVVDSTGQVIGTSGVTPVAAGATVAVAVQAPNGGSASAGVNTAVLLTVLAGSLGIAALAYGLTRDEASPSR